MQVQPVAHSEVQTFERLHYFEVCQKTAHLDATTYEGENENNVTFLPFRIVI